MYSNLYHSSYSNKVNFRGTFASDDYFSSTSSEEDGYEYQNKKTQKIKFNSNSDDHLSRKLNVIIDLDKTLVFSTCKKESFGDFLITINQNNCPTQIVVHKRPMLDQFLMELSKFATIFLFTAAEAEYTNEIIYQIDPLSILFAKTFTRDDCIKVGPNQFKKDFNICKTDMSRTVIIDDIPSNFEDFKANGIAVKPFDGQSNDNELAYLLPKLVLLSKLSDVRCFEPSIF